MRYSHQEKRSGLRCPPSFGSGRHYCLMQQLKSTAIAATGNPLMMAAAHPANPTTPFIYFNTTDKHLYLWNGSAYVPLDV